MVREGPCAMPPRQRPAATRRVSLDRDDVGLPLELLSSKASTRRTFETTMHRDEALRLLVAATRASGGKGVSMALRRPSPLPSRSAERPGGVRSARRAEPFRAFAGPTRDGVDPMHVL